MMMRMISLPMLMAQSKVEPGTPNQDVAIIADLTAPSSISELTTFNELHIKRNVVIAFL